MTCEKYQQALEKKIGGKKNLPMRVNRRDKN